MTKRQTSGAINTSERNTYLYCTSSLAGHVSTSISLDNPTVLARVSRSHTATCCHTLQSCVRRTAGTGGAGGGATAEDWLFAEAPAPPPAPVLPADVTALPADDAPAPAPALVSPPSALKPARAASRCLSAFICFNACSRAISIFAVADSCVCCRGFSMVASASVWRGECCDGDGAEGTHIDFATFQSRGGDLGALQGLAKRLT